MIAAYAFLAAFTVQIAVVSLLSPVWYTKYARAKGAKYFADARNAQLYSGILRIRSERFLALYRGVNMVIALLLLGLLVWLAGQILRPDWDDALARRVLALSTSLQMAPFVLACVTEFWIHKKAVVLAPPEPKRTASLQRRGVFDFVSPHAIFLAGLLYLLFAAAMVYFWLNPFPDFNHPLWPLRGITFAYVFNAVLAYWMLYGRRNAPLETRAGRMKEAAIGIPLLVYVCIAMVLFTSITVTLREFLHEEKWIPFSVSVFLVLVVLLSTRMFRQAAARTDADCLNPSPAS
jgi:hypothetical protein